MTIEETAGWLQTRPLPDPDPCAARRRYRSCAAALCGALRQIGKTAYVLANPGADGHLLPIMSPATMHRKTIFLNVLYLPTWPVWGCSQKTRQPYQTH